LVAQHATEMCAFKECKTITIHTQSGIIVLVQTNSFADPEFNLIGITSTEGDWVGMKKNLNDLLSVIMSSSISLL